MAKQAVIAVDVMGGDNSPSVVLKGVESALLADANLSVVLTGPEEVVKPFANAHERCSFEVATEVIGMAEHPARAVRKKKDSSIVVGCKLVKQGRAQGFFSAGSTGACLAAATLFIGRIKGVMRPCLATVVPSPARPVIFCDIGANADCKSEYILQFAQMGSVYASKMLNYEHPKVGLLNIGEEDTKGSMFAQATNALLREKLENFAGNAEGRDLLEGKFEVVVTDGFSGNVCLKTIEGTSKVLFRAIKQAMLSSLATKLAALVLKGSFKQLAAQVSPDTYGGAPLLGLRGACIIGHGSSNELAVKNGILTTANIVREGVSEIIEQTLRSSE